MHKVIVLIVYDIGNSIHYVIFHPYKLHIIFNQKKSLYQLNWDVRLV